MQYTNSQILAAVLNKWLQPVVLQLSQAKMASFPFVQAIENKVKSIGFVSPNWSLTQELSPMIEPITNSIVQPMLNKYLSNVPDEAIPAMAHGIIDKALANGKLELMEGKLIFDKDDLTELKKLLDYNLPLGQTEGYSVRTAPSETSTEKVL
jgi:hypothetical protein|nr:MAG TPA: hypothetical protein [Caudoviricetes sp.]DAY73221.1 MAG TPA: hypothetical protein [Caudoviricetes sp.]